VLCYPVHGGAHRLQDVAHYRRVFFGAFCLRASQFTTEPIS
jgi:hypothetical protein